MYQYYKGLYKRKRPSLISEGLCRGENIISFNSFLRDEHSVHDYVSTHLLCLQVEYTKYLSSVSTEIGGIEIENN